MGHINCAVIGCTNGSYGLDKWKQLECKTHPGQLHKVCGCEPPYTLFCFPSTKRNKEKIDKWTSLLRRRNQNFTKWIPKKSDRVCSDHFVDKVPTIANPNPTIKMGYDLKEKAKEPRRSLNKTLPQDGASCRKKKKTSTEDINNSQPSTSHHQQSSISSSSHVSSTPASSSTPFLSPSSSPPTQNEHDYCFGKHSVKCHSCETKDHVIEALRRKVAALTLQARKLKDKASQKPKNPPFSWTLIKSNLKMNFYTGTTSIAIFNAIFSLLYPYLKYIKPWRGSKEARRKSKVGTVSWKYKCKKLSLKDQFFLTLVRLRLGLLNEDLADRFQISTGLCSEIFKTWISFLSSTLGQALINWIPKEAVLEHMPKVFKEKGYSNVRVIIDCFESFIERSKSLEVQAVTWSDYKHHNTIKFLLGISPAGFITFLSDCYGGRASDKFICQDSGFFDVLEFGDEVMADRGFQITEELLARNTRLVIPPGARLKSQMTFGECSKTKSVANLRIHVERAIRRIKTFRILTTVIPISMLHSIDDIVCVCGALCNLKPKLINEKKKKNN